MYTWREGERERKIRRKERDIIIIIMITSVYPTTISQSGIHHTGRVDIDPKHVHPIDSTMSYKDSFELGKIRICQFIPIATTEPLFPVEQSRNSLAFFNIQSP